ncbi:hypothetical protein OGAPHI_002944 [Ogataea philodendri]|uniref:Uncharacterized protein n=1 Tax=Ogataea philodendri TaxID=1378263 RepID=A0A9P8T6N8_9ASCO|nr:uncharacterized protein OGAPHI_002944 [Ogataea philodendri]KAH3667295.1 hypothetical protein OGAPHI_002944 [Ogataea philodendri]
MGPDREPKSVRLSLSSSVGSMISTTSSTVPARSQFSFDLGPVTRDRSSWSIRSRVTFFHGELSSVVSIPANCANWCCRLCSVISDPLIDPDSASALMKSYVIQLRRSFGSLQLKISTSIGALFFRFITSLRLFTSNCSNSYCGENASSITSSDNVTVTVSILKEYFKCPLAPEFITKFWNLIIPSSHEALKSLPVMSTCNLLSRVISFSRTFLFILPSVKRLPA